jgi:hypothetical protein
MKNLKKAVSLLITLVLVLSISFSAFASSGGDITTGTGGGTFTGGGSVEDVDMSDVFKVTLPTNINLDFVLDPYGLASLEHGASGELYGENGLLDESEGKIIFNQPDTAITVISNSSVNLQVGIELLVTNNDTKGTDDTADDTSDAVTVNATQYAYNATGAAYSVEETAQGVTGNTVFIRAVTSETNVPAINTAYDWPADTVTAAFIPLKSTAQYLNYYLPKANYAIANTVVDGENNYTFQQSLSNPDSQGTRIKLEGWINKYADWSDFKEGGTKSLGITMRYAFQEGPADLSALSGDKVDDTAHYYGVKDNAIDFYDFTVYSFETAAGVAYTAFPASTVEVTLKVVGLNANAVISRIAVNGVEVNSATYTIDGTNKNEITFLAGKAWPNNPSIKGQTSMVLSIASGTGFPTPRDITIDGLTFGQ